MTLPKLAVVSGLAIGIGALVLAAVGLAGPRAAGDFPTQAVPRTAPMSPLDDLPPVPQVPTAEQPLDPPPPRPEVRPAEPSPDHVWISGHWEREPDSWSWVEGQWVKPPFLPVRWVPGYWQHRLGRFYWVQGHWADTNEPGMVVLQPIPAPAAIEEPVPPPPGTDAVWVPGEWSWNGTWAWSPGYYTQRPTPLSKWVPGHWEVGLLGRWKWAPGHWSLF